MSDLQVDPQTRYVRSDRVIGREFMGEYLLVPLAGSTANLTSIFATNPVGSFIWSLCDGQHSGRDIVAKVVEEFDTTPRQAEADYAIFLEQLLSVGAVTPTANSGAPR